MKPRAHPKTIAASSRKKLRLQPPLLPLVGCHQKKRNKNEKSEGKCCTHRQSARQVATISSPLRNQRAKHMHCAKPSSSWQLSSLACQAVCEMCNERKPQRGAGEGEREGEGEKVRCRVITLSRIAFGSRLPPATCQLPVCQTSRLSVHKKGSLIASSC